MALDLLRTCGYVSPLPHYRLAFPRSPCSIDPASVLGVTGATSHCFEDVEP